MDWIDINERKPEIGQQCLVYFDEERGHKTTALITYDASYPFTHWMPTPPPPRKVRWKVPSEGSEYYFIDIYGDVKRRIWDNDDPTFYRKFLGVYLTEKEAIEMAQKIRDFVTNEIGEID